MLKIRTAIAINLSIGFEECIRYGMIGWSSHTRFILWDITAMQIYMNGSRMLGGKFVEETLHWEVVFAFQEVRRCAAEIDLASRQAHDTREVDRDVSNEVSSLNLDCFLTLHACSALRLSLCFLSLD